MTADVYMSNERFRAAKTSSRDCSLGRELGEGGFRDERCRAQGEVGNSLLRKK